ncbi:MAG: SDR family oxidoreductase [Acidobacteriota bacterium]
MIAGLLTGATGLLGARVVRELGRRDEHWAVTRRGSSGPGLDDAAVEHAPGVDLTEPGSLLEWLGRERPRVVLHLAAAAAPADCERDPDTTRRVNVEASRTLARTCQEHGLRFVLVSTDMVFGRDPSPETGFRERDEPTPVNEYGRQKLAAEEAVLDEADDVLVVRVPLLFGDSLGRGRGATDALLAAWRRGETTPLFTDELRTPLDLGSTAAGLLELAAGQRRGRLHLGGPERLSRHELGEALRRRVNAPASLVRTTSAAEIDPEGRRPRDCCLDSREAWSTLSFTPPSLTEALEREAPESLG